MNEEFGKNKKKTTFDDLVDTWLDIICGDPKVNAKKANEGDGIKRTPVCIICGQNRAEDDVVFYPASSKKYGNCRVKIPFCYSCFDKLLDEARKTFAKPPEIVDVITGKAFDEPVYVNSYDFRKDSDVEGKNEV